MNAIGKGESYNSMNRVMRSINSIEYVDAATLKGWMRQGRTQLSQPFQVIDVRGSDYIGGHVKNSWNYPYSKFTERLPELYDKLEAKREGSVVNVVFHCAQSQQRGPSAAMKYLRELPEDKLGLHKLYILRGGFNHWQDVYGEDEQLTADYKPDLWSW